MHVAKSAVAGLALSGLIGVTPVAGQTAAAYDKTILTFDAPVLVPGATLPEGSYIFRMADAMSNRQIVQIIGQDTSKIWATTMTIPASREDMTGNIVVTFASTPSDGSPPAVKSWFYPGQTTGHHFIYPMEQAKKISAVTKTLVLEADVDGDMVELNTEPIMVVDESGAASDFEARREEYESLIPSVSAASGDRAASSGNVDIPSHGPALVTHHIEKILDLAEAELGEAGTPPETWTEEDAKEPLTLTRAQLEAIVIYAQEAREALDRTSTSTR